jgi:hypothetical protein
MQPGDTVDIRGGTYRTPLYINKSGTSGGHLRFVGHAGETVVIDLAGWGGSPSDGINMVGRQYIDISRLNMFNAPGYGVVATANSANITISDVEIGYSHPGGAVFEGGSNITVTRARVHHNNNGGNWHEGVTFSGVQTFALTDSEVYANAKEGIDAKYGARNGTISGNHAYANNGPNIYIDAASSIRVTSNLCHEPVSRMKACMMVSTETTYNPGRFQTSDITIANNIFYASGGGVSFWFEDASFSWVRLDRIRIEYNTFVDNNVNDWGGIYVVNGSNNFGTGNTIRNNIFIGNGGKGIRDDAGVFWRFAIDHNLFQNGEYSTAFGVSPIFTSASPFVNRSGRDYHLTSSAAARFVGQPIGDVTVDFDGVARPGSSTDVGALQYSNGGTPPPPPPPPAASCSLSATPNSIAAGGSTLLSWTTANATGMSINQSIGGVAPVAAGSIGRTLSATTTFTATASGSGGNGTCSATVTVSAAPPPPTDPPPPPPSGASVWNSWDVVMQSGGTPAAVTASATGVTTSVELYESTNDNGVNKGSAFGTFNSGGHPEGFNAVQQYWAYGSGIAYPYAGKSTVNRGSGGGESNSQAPLGVRDLQLHPANNLHYVVAAFRVPFDGSYTITNLGVRRVYDQGGDVRYHVLNAQKAEIATLQATANRDWVNNPGTFALGNLTAGTYLYFAVDRGASDNYFDATEIAWTVTGSGQAAPPPPPPPAAAPQWNSWDVRTQNGSPQATVVAAATGASAAVEFYESTDNGGVMKGSLFGGFTAGTHPEAFNNVQQYWGATTGVVYPYAGRSTMVRGTDAGESNAPSPAGVQDLQLHPPDNGHLVVAAFKVPTSGTYTVSNLGARRVAAGGNDVVYHVFNSQRVKIASIRATANQDWVTDSNTYTLSGLTAGSYIYFAVDRGADFFYYDATEIAWTVTRTGN